MNDTNTTERGLSLSTVDPAFDRVPKEHEEKRGRDEGQEVEDWIAAEDRRLVNRLARAVRRAGA